MAGRALNFHFLSFKIYSDWIQASPTLDLVNDYFRFVIAFSEVISASAPHIYHSALPLSPRTSIVHELYKSHSRPLVRVVRGFPISWESVVTTVQHRRPKNKTAVWSPCSKFIAVAQSKAIEILDAVTLTRIGGFEHKGKTRWLGFSPDSRSLTQFSHGDYGITIWDLQTGGRISTIPSTPNTSLSRCFSSAYSIDGKMVAVACRDSENTAVTIISTYNLLSGTHIYSHRVSEGCVVAPIWTHGEFLRFVTVKPGSITIWEVGFTSKHTLAEVESLPAPDDITPDEIIPDEIAPDDVSSDDASTDDVSSDDASTDDVFPDDASPDDVSPDDASQNDASPDDAFLNDTSPNDASPDDTGPEKCLFLPARSRLAFIFREAVMLWDAQNSELLLKFSGDKQPAAISFSSDGRFFACGTIGQKIHLWKESPTDYVLHRKLVSSIDKEMASAYIMREDTTPLLSPNGESITTSKYSETQLWRTTDPITFLPSAPTQPVKKTDFVLGFSPDKSLAAIARLGDNMATILDLKSGDPRLIVDTGMKICGLGVTGNTVIVIGYGKIVTWDLPAGDCALDISASIHNSVRTVAFNHPAPPPTRLHSASISPDFNYIVITREASGGLDIYDISTGKHLVGVTASYGHIPWFTQDGRDVWSARRFPAEGWNITKDGQSGVIGLGPLSGACPSGRYPWKSSHGHNVTNDGWIFNSRKKRLMWMPHYWRKYERYRIWDGRFFVLLDLGLPEPVILDLELDE